MTFDENNDEHVAYRDAIHSINALIVIVDICDDDDCIDYVSCSLNNMTFDIVIDRATIDRYFDNIT